VSAELWGVPLSDWIRVRAESEPGKTAVVCGSRRLSYRSLHEQVEQLAARLTTLGMGRGGLAAAVLPNAPEFALAFFALQRVGAAMLPLSPELQPAEVREALRDAAPDFLLRAGDRGVTAERVSSAGMAGSHARARAPRARGDRSAASAAVGPDAPALCQYSSGSMGAAKRIVRTGKQLAAEAECFHATAHTRADDRFLCAIPLVHAHGFSNCLLASVYAGGTLVLHESFDRGVVGEALSGAGITIFPGVPFMFRSLGARAKVRKEAGRVTGVGDVAAGARDRAPELRLCISAGAPLTRAAFEGFRDSYGVAVRQLYGTSETGAVTLNMESALDATWDSVGTPLAGVEVAILGPEGEAVPGGVGGEVGIRSPGMFDGYPEGEGSGRSHFRGPYFLPGDRGRFDSFGRLYLTGRITTFINAGGRKVDPAEVEGVLGSHPGVEEVAVVGVPLSSGEEAIKAVVVPAGRCTTEALVAHCRGRLAAYKVPRIVEFREELPRSALGKLLREQLRRPAGDRELA